MEIIGIGTKYSGTVKGVTNPKVYLYNNTSKKYYAAQIGTPEDNVYPFTYTPEMTQSMLPGNYTLEIYNSDEDVLIGRVLDFAKAIIISKSSSQGSDDGNPSNP